MVQVLPSMSQLIFHHYWSSFAVVLKWEAYFLYSLNEKRVLWGSWTTAVLTYWGPWLKTVENHWSMDCKSSAALQSSPSFLSSNNNILSHPCNTISFYKTCLLDWVLLSVKPANLVITWRSLQTARFWNVNVFRCARQTEKSGKFKYFFQNCAALIPSDFYLLAIHMNSFNLWVIKYC